MILRFLRAVSMYAWALLIAMLLWFQVHGQGESTVSMDVSLQLRGLPDNMVLINDLPDHVKITVSGLQARLKLLDESKLFLVIAAGDVHEPGVFTRPVDAATLVLPPGLTVDKVQPDRLKLQVDRLVKKTVAVEVRFDLPEGWQVHQVSVQPAEVTLTGPEIWLETLESVPTEALRPPLTPGLVKMKADIVIPAEKAIKQFDKEQQFVVQGVLSRIVQQERERNPLPEQSLQSQE